MVDPIHHLPRDEQIAEYSKYARRHRSAYYAAKLRYREHGLSADQESMRANKSLLEWALNNLKRLDADETPASQAS